MKEELHSYDPAEGLTDLESIEVFLVDAFESGDADYITKALAIVCSGKGRSEIANETGQPLALLYESLEKGTPTLRTVLAVTRALGLDLTIRSHRLQAAGGV